MRTTRRGVRLWFLALLAVGSAGCGLNVGGVPSDDTGDTGPDAFDGDVPPPDEATEDASDVEATACTTAAECDDGIPCTTDICTPGAGTCSHSPDDASCDDHDACNGTESCDPARGCVSGTPVDCDDGVGCTDDLCNPDTGTCLRALVHERCTPPQVCDPPRSPDATGCADPPACTTDPECADEDLCNGNETCGPDNLCRPGTPVVCDDGVACTLDSCVPDTGACVFTPPDLDADTYGDAECFGTDCDDADPTVHPGAAETCNGLDEDCDTVPDNDATCASQPNASVECVAGSCVATCLPGWLDCDTLPGNGCELATGAPDSCGTSCTDVVDCGTLPHVRETGCTDGACTIAGCAEAYAECNDVLDDGCELLLDDDYNTCADAESMGSIRGDYGDDVLTHPSYGELWVSFRVTEARTSSLSELTATVTLDVPPDVDYDVFVHCGTSGCSSSGPSGTNPAGVDESVGVRWNDAAGDSARTVYVEVRFVSGSTLDCGGWTLTVTGNTDVASATCS
ncbi:MAG: putative metal-binding motif-containing protein [Deltaproteobacteria bacterium]|nr:putative metal-binding motif-containing protein [Deltaproteobacteria bacterium]